MWLGGYLTYKEWKLSLLGIYPRSNYRGYLTYKEWKLNDCTEYNTSFSPADTLPIRNGNILAKALQPIILPSSPADTLPIRNGNTINKKL